MGAFGPFTGLENEANDFVWASACAFSCLLRIHIRDAVVFYVTAVLKRSVLDEYRVLNSVPYGRWTGATRAVWRQRRGLLGLARRTLIGRCVVPELQQRPLKDDMSSESRDTVNV
jgi:hypothetical protein